MYVAWGEGSAQHVPAVCLPLRLGGAWLDSLRMVCMAAPRARSHVLSGALDMGRRQRLGQASSATHLTAPEL